MKLNEQQILERRLYRQFSKGVKTYGLIDPHDHILVGLSGGKDSMALLELLARYASIQQPAFIIEAVHVRMENIRYESDPAYLQAYAESLGVRFHLRTGCFTTDLNTKRPACFLCSWNRRKILFETAKELGCNKIALGHHMDDILHTTLLNQLFEGQFSTIPVKLRMRKFPMAIIRPLCRIEEADLLAWSVFRKYRRQVKSCPFETTSKRTDVKGLFAQMERLNPEARYSMWHALEKENKLIEE